MEKASNSEFTLLLRATLELYVTTVSEALGGFAKNWWVPLVHLLLLIVLSIILIPLQLFGIVGGFALGLLLALLLGCYLALVEVAVEKERLSLAEIWPRARDAFFPVLSVLFVLYIFDMLAALALRSAAQQNLRMFLNLLIAIIFNPLPEVIYQRRSTSLEMFGECYDFIRENLVEWFLPAVLLLTPLIFLGVANNELGRTSVRWLLSTNPLTAVEHCLLFLSSSWTSGIGLVVVVVFLYILYLFFILRGVLYKKLSQSTRRKRIYDYRMK